MSCHCAPGLGGIIWRRMTNRPEMPRDSRAGVMSNQMHSATSQATNSNTPHQRSTRVSGGGPKARGKRARMSATVVIENLEPQMSTQMNADQRKQLVLVVQLHRRPSAMHLRSSRSASDSMPHSARPMASVRSRSEVRSIRLTARMISTMIAPISW